MPSKGTDTSFDVGDMYGSRVRVMGEGTMAGWHAGSFRWPRCHEAGV